MRRGPLKRFAVAAALLALLIPAAASACPRTTMASIENTVMCQVCGVPLGLATESPEAVRERAFIANLIAQCRSASQIRTALVAQYGASVLALPPKHGFDIAAYLVPLLGVLCAGAMVAMVVLAWRHRHGSGGNVVPARLDLTDAARVEAALERFEM